MEGIGEDGDGVCEISSKKFNGHEDEGHAGNLDEFIADLLML